MEVGGPRLTAVYCGLAGRPLEPVAVTPRVEAAAIAAAAALPKNPPNHGACVLSRTTVYALIAGDTQKRSPTASTLSSCASSSTT